MNTYKKDQRLFEEGDVPLGAFCIKKGKVKIVAYSESGQEKIVNIIGEGGLIGYEAVISDQRHKFSAIAIEDTIACLVYKKMMLSLLDMDKNFSKKLMAIASDTITANYKFQAEVSYGTVLSRLVLALLDLDRIFEGNGIRMSKGNIAQVVGTVNETLSRALRQLKEQGLVTEEERQIQIVDREKLREYAKSITSSRLSH